MELLSSAAPRCVLLLEDIDCLFESSTDAEQDTHNTTRSSTLTFAGLLNAIDGVAAQEGRLLVITTNHPEQLGSALVRPGRVDLNVHFGMCTQYQVERFVKQFYVGQAGLDVKPFVQAIPEGAISVAQLQGVLMQNKEDPVAALKQLQHEFGCNNQTPIAGSRL